MREQQKLSGPKPYRRFISRQGCTLDTPRGLRSPQKILLYLPSERSYLQLDFSHPRGITLVSNLGNFLWKLPKSAPASYPIFKQLRWSFRFAPGTAKPLKNFSRTLFSWTAVILSLYYMLAYTLTYNIKQANYD